MLIPSLNADKPYEKFVLEQLAGDAIAPGVEAMRARRSGEKAGTGAA